MLVQVVEHFVLSKASALGHPSLELGEGDLAVAQAAKQRLVDMGETRHDIFIAVVSLELRVQELRQLDCQLFLHVLVPDHLVEHSEGDPRQVRVAHQLRLELLVRHILEELHLLAGASPFGLLRGFPSRVRRL